MYINAFLQDMIKVIYLTAQKIHYKARQRNKRIYKANQYFCKKKGIL